MWFRAEKVDTVNWAGNPHKAVQGGTTMPLMPRASFDAWSEIVEGRSAAWTLSEIEAANRLQRKMFEVQQAHRLRALNLELIATINDNKNLLEQKDYLIKEVNHRVQNIFYLIVADKGEGKVTQREGFGTRMLNAMVKSLGGTIEQTGNNPDCELSSPRRF